MPHPVTELKVMFMVQNPAVSGSIFVVFPLHENTGFKLELPLKVGGKSHFWFLCEVSLLHLVYDAGRELRVSVYSDALFVCPALQAPLKGWEGFSVHKAGACLALKLKFCNCLTLV